MKDSWVDLLSQKDLDRAQKVLESLYSRIYYYKELAKRMRAKAPLGDSVAADLLEALIKDLVASTDYIAGLHAATGLPVSYDVDTAGIDKLLDLAEEQSEDYLSNKYGAKASATDKKDLN